VFLALDTAADFCSVALADGPGRLLASFHQSQARGHAETLVPMIERALKKARTTPAALRGIVVTIGPGTFAGVRVGLSAARALGFATGTKVLGLTSFEALMGLAVLKHGGRLPPRVLTTIPGRGAEVAAALFSPAKEKRPPWTLRKGPATITATEAGAWLGNGPALVIGPAVGGLAPTFSGGEVSTENAWPRAEELLRMKDFLPAARWGKRPSPFYLRPPDAKPSVLLPHG
jgi:tRNA threonylcarbamoyladenosine biosynthesis protein TsaB